MMNETEHLLIIEVLNMLDEVIQKLDEASANPHIKLIAHLLIGGINVAELMLNQGGANAAGQGEEGKNP